MFRNVIHIDAAESPNVIEGRQVIPGIVTAEEYAHREATWDEVMRCIGLRGKHYRGAELLLYPPQWLNRAAQLAEGLRVSGKPRTVRSIGCDPGEGVASTVWAGADELGLVFLKSLKTPDTSLIVTETVNLMTQWKVEAEFVLFDRGGGGKQHADVLRSMGHEVRTVSFGESLVLDPKRGLRPLSESRELREERSVYLNRRAQMYGILSDLLNPVRELENMGYPSPYGPVTGFAIPMTYGHAAVGQDDCPMRTTGYGEAGAGGGYNRGGRNVDGDTSAAGSGSVNYDPYVELRRQLAKIPKLRDGEGKLFLPPKNRKPGETAGQARKTLVEILGCSPDEADAVVLACYGLVEEGQQSVATAY